MGYYVNIVHSNAFIHANMLSQAYDAMCKLNETNAHKNGGSYSKMQEKNEIDGPHDGVWFSWMPWNYPEKCKDACEILSELGFETEYDSNLNLHIHSYDSKIGDESLFLESIAPYIESGTHIHWRGEDGEEWRHYFKDGVMWVQHPEKIIWYPHLQEEDEVKPIVQDQEFLKALDKAASSLDCLMKKINDMKE